MKKVFYVVCLLFVLKMNFVYGAVNHDSSLVWNTLETPHFLIHYHDDLESTAQNVGEIFEQVHQRLTEFFNWIPRQRTDVVLTDRLDIGLSFANIVQEQSITLRLNGVDVLAGNGDTLTELITHEYTHILHLDKVTGKAGILRAIFGRSMWSFPARFQPLWMIEGLASYAQRDSLLNPEGDNAAYFDMLMRIEVEQGIKPIYQVNQAISTWPAGVTPYLYGQYFYRFVEKKFGKQAIQNLVDNYSDNILPYFINSNAKESLNTNLNTLWGEFGHDLKDRYQPLLNQIERNGIRQGEKVTDHGGGTHSLHVLEDGTVFYIRSDGNNPAAIMRSTADLKDPSTIHRVFAGARIDVHKRSGILLSQLDWSKNTNLFFDLYHLDLDGGNKTRLTHGGRYREALWSADGSHIIALRQVKGLFSLHLLEKDGTYIQELWQGKGTIRVSEMSASPDGKRLVASVWRKPKGWNLELFDIEERRWYKLTDDSVLYTDARFDTDVNTILVSSNHGGVFNLHQLKLESGKSYTLTNVKGGAFQPVRSVVGNEIYYIGYGHKGYDVFKLNIPNYVAENKIEFSINPTQIVTYAQTATQAKFRTKKYSSLSNLKPSWWFPHFFLSEDKSEWGLVSGASDPLHRHNYEMLLAYDLRQKLPLGSFVYTFDRWNPAIRLSLSRFNSVQRNIDRDILRVSRQDTFMIEAIQPFLSLKNRWALHVNAYRHTESDEVRAENISPGQRLTDNILALGLVYDSTEYQRLAISQNSGRTVSFVVEDSDALNGDYSGQVITLDWREFIKFGQQQVLAVRFVAGYGTDQPRPFNLGGSSNANGLGLYASAINTPLVRAPMNQRQFALRGYETGLPQLTGRRMQLFSAEWRFPMFRIEGGLMVPPIAIDRITGRLFVDHGGTWDTDRKNGLTGVGIESNILSRLFYRMNFNVRLGYAYGFDEGGGQQLYFTIGSSF